MRPAGLGSTTCDLHQTLGYRNQTIYHWDFGGGEADFKKALELNRNDTTAHQWYAEESGLDRPSTAVRWAGVQRGQARLLRLVSKPVATLDSVDVPRSAQGRAGVRFLPICWVSTYCDSPGTYFKKITSSRPSEWYDPPVAFFASLTGCRGR